MAQPAQGGSVRVVAIWCAVIAAAAGVSLETQAAIPIPGSTRHVTLLLARDDRAPSIVPAAFSALIAFPVSVSSTPVPFRDPATTTGAWIDGSGPGWRALGEHDFEDVNGEPHTWTWESDLLRSTGRPIGVYRTSQAFTNFEIVIEWRHLETGGNSGLFVWVPMEALRGLPPDRLPDQGIEVQMLDHGYTRKYESESGKAADWFTTHGDVFAVGRSKLIPFEPRSPNGSRSFPRDERSRGAGEWNHYYVRGINGELRLWVNGAEVSGGRDAHPRMGHLCLEAEGSPIEFRNIRVRELP